MSSRQNVSAASLESRGIRKPLSKIEKYHNRPASGSTKSLSGNVGYHGSCVKSPSKETERPQSGKIKTSNPKFSSTLKKPVPSQKSVGQASLKPIAVSNPRPLRAETSLSQEDLKQLASKFEQLSASILQLATSPEPLGTRSLEALLTREISNSLGDAINNPKFSQGFIQATRNLLGSLVYKYEAGEVNTKLIKRQKFSKQPFLRASSNTTLCFRDRYIKELVMNTLQSMCTDVVEAEVSQAAPVLSAASQERVRVIRDMVRAEAGIEPAAFAKLEKNLADLRRTFSQNQLDMLRAAREVERAISKHLPDHGGCCDSRSSSDCVKIPEAAKENIRGKHLASSESSCINGENCVSKPKTKVNDLESHYSDKFFKNFLRNAHYVQRSPDVLRSTPIEKEKNNVKNENILENIRPQIQKITQDELIRVQEKSKSILKLEKGADKVMILNNLLESSSEKIDLENIIDYGDDDDYNDEEVTRIFLKALVKDMDQNQAMKISNNFNRNMEKIDEDDEEITSEETRVYLKALKRDKTKIKTVPEIFNSNIKDSTKPLEKLLDDRVISNFTTNVALGVPPRNFSYANFEIDSNTLIPKFEIDKQESDCRLQRLKSKWWSIDDSDSNKIIEEMNQAFKIFGSTDYPLNNIETNKQTTESNFEEESSVILGTNELEFTIDEMAQVAMQLSTKICQLPLYLNDENSSVFSITQKNQMLNILETLRTFFINKSHLPDYDFATGLKDETQLLLLISRVSNYFYCLSEKLVQTPSHLKNNPFSLLKPPEILIKSLALLASTGYFKDCFIYTVAQRHCSRSNELLNKNQKKESFEKSELNQLISTREVDEEVASTQCTNEIEVVKPYNMEEQKSSREIVIGTLKDDIRKSNIEHRVKSRATISKNLNRPAEVAKHLTNFEHYLGLSSSVMSVQNVSDMFLLLSTVLNDVPDRIKSEKILSLKPPSTLLEALDILYSASDDSLNYVEKKTSVDSLTIQNTSDFFLTLSKALQDIPPRLKNSPILELDPPLSLLRAVNLLTSLSLNSVLDSRSQEEVVEETFTPVTCNKVDSQEKFFDAVNSFTSLGVNS